MQCSNTFIVEKLNKTISNACNGRSWSGAWALSPTFINLASKSLNGILSASEQVHPMKPFSLLLFPFLHRLFRKRGLTEVKVVQFFGTEQLQPGLMVTTRRTRRTESTGRSTWDDGARNGVGCHKSAHPYRRNECTAGGREEGAEWGN